MAELVKEFGICVFEQYAHGDLLFEDQGGNVHRGKGFSSMTREAYYQDWAFETKTATSNDAMPLRTHPHYGLPSKLSRLWDGRLILGSSETAQNFGGYLEGALERANEVARSLI